jgi:hypothetical protein
VARSPDETIIYEVVYSELIDNLENNSGVSVVWLSNVPTIFDGGSMQFIDPVDMYSNSQEYDKYLVFPKTTILG